MFSEDLTRRLSVTQGEWEKKQILNWDRASQNRPSSRGREKQEALSC